MVMAEISNRKQHYDDDKFAEAFLEWNAEAERAFCDSMVFGYFGDLGGKTIVDFGCGNGFFIRECLKRGAAYGLGLDVNETMINAGKKMVHENDGHEDKMRLIVQDCFQPIKESYTQFDLAACQFVLHSCESESKLATFLANVFNPLKPGGKICISLCPFANSKHDQEAIADIFGLLVPLKSDANGRDPFFTEVPSFRRAKPEEAVEGKLYTREVLLTLNDYFWSKEKIMKAMKEAGFVEIEILMPSKQSWDISPLEAKLAEELEEPFVFIGGKKP